MHFRIITDVYTTPSTRVLARIPAQVKAEPVSKSEKHELPFLNGSEN